MKFSTELFPVLLVMTSILLTPSEAIGQKKKAITTISVIVQYERSQSMYSVRKVSTCRLFEVE